MFLQKVGIWFQNHRDKNTGVKSTTADGRLVTTWTLRKVVKKEMLEEINEVILNKDPLAHPGSVKYLKHLQDSITEVMNGLSKEQVVKFEALVAAWNADGVEPDVQAQYVQTYASQLCLNFAIQTGRQEICQSGQKVYG
jgi:hypothetical protein